MNKYIVTKEYCLNFSKEKIKKLFTQIQNSLNDEEFNEEFLQEVVGNISSAGFISFVSMVGGGIALFVNPVAGTFVLISSIAYGSWLKVCCGRYYRERQKRIKQSRLMKKVVRKIENISKKPTSENTILNVSRKWRHYSSIKFIKRNTTKYGFMRLTSNINTRSKKVLPEITN